MLKEKYCDCGTCEISNINMEMCPLCGGKNVKDTDLLDYILQKYEINYNDLRNEYIKSAKNIEGVGLK